MAESETPKETNAVLAASADTNLSAQPAKKSKKPRRMVKKSRATTPAGDDLKGGEGRVISRRPVRKRTAKNAKKTVANSENKSEIKQDWDSGVTIPMSLPVAKHEEEPAVEAVVEETASSKQVEPIDMSIPRALVPEETSIEKPLEGTGLGSETSKTDQKIEYIEEKENTQERSGVRNDIQWGRRSKRTAPVGWEEQAGLSSSGRSSRPVISGEKAEGVVPRAVDPSVVEVPAQENMPESDTDGDPGDPIAEDAADRSAEMQESHMDNQENRSDYSEQDGRRSRRRRRGRGRRGEDRNRPAESVASNRPVENQGNRGEVPRSEPQRNEDRNRNETRNRDDRNRSREERQDGNRPSRALTELLAENWTEDKTRRFLGEGLLAQLSPRLTALGDSRTVPDTDALREPLRMIRKVLADECMVGDDAADLMLLDVVMSALVDRIDVCRLQAKSQSLEDLEVLMDLRYKADRRLIEALTALKNA